jgi:predicted transcriptional regulator
MQREHERERDELAEEVERARSAYRRAMRAWEP